jgi:hypothetical protein
MVPVLMDHEISEPAKATWGHLAVSPGAFREQLAYLRDAGYTVLTAGAIAAMLAEDSQVPRAPLSRPQRRVRRLSPTRCSGACRMTAVGFIAAKLNAAAVKPDLVPQPQTS